MERLFPPAGKFEGRTRRAEMHLYMVVSFDKDIEVTQAMGTMKTLDDIESIEPVYEIELADIGQKATPFLSQPYSLSRDDNMPFDDPRLKDQWHYNNTGSVRGGIVGADLNLFKAWEITTGTPNVIVCIVDGGLLLSHPDLKDNLWVNEAELNGTPGEDSDGNGYVDDIHGWCFVENTSDIQPDDSFHGTHVAGTVAARNNNGIGVSGVAGGNGQPNTGARLMSAAIFRDKGQANSTNSANAIKYGADNGAVISQNSWGWPHPITTIPSYTRAAIDYFIKYAGCDDDGSQLADSPMKGGVVLFAAGNSGNDYLSQPASYEPVVAVTAMSTNFTKASYTDHGFWADIMAPGGDQDRYGTQAGVLSTTNNNYSYFQGTSMACPHASGVAALVVSRFGGMGYTNEMLKEQLYASILPVNIDGENRGFEGKLGAGYLDAYAAVRNQNEDKAPDAPNINMDKSSDNQLNSINLFWEVPKDEDDEQASFYKLYYSDVELTKSNYKEKGRLLGPANGFINGHGKLAGEEMEYTVTRLKPSTQYYFVLIAYDRWKIESEPTVFSVSTKMNEPPKILNVPTEPITIYNAPSSVANYNLEVKDPEGDTWTYTIDGDTDGVSHTRESGEDIIKLTITSALNVGNYKLIVTLKDKLGAESKTEIPFRILELSPPTKTQDILPQLLGVENGDIVIDLNAYFEQKELLPLTFTAKTDKAGILTANVSNEGTLALKAQKTGEANVTIVASNGYKTTEATFMIQVTQDKNNAIYSVWPIPVIDNLNAWVNAKYKSASFIITTPRGEEVINKKENVDNKGIATVDLSKLAPGTYSLKIETSGETFTQTIVKQ
jgi:subtilisin family serine protease